MRTGLIWAQGRDRVIGNQGVLPWHLPEDLAHFRCVTLGQPVVMGRRTWESIPVKFRPLPGRLNIVVSAQAGLVLEGARVAASLPEALAFAHACSPPAAHAHSPGPHDIAHAHVWVIGGASLYAQALPLASRVVMTQIDAQYAGDAQAPALDDAWQQIDEPGIDARWQCSTTGVRYRFLTFERVQVRDAATVPPA